MSKWVGKPRIGGVIIKYVYVPCGPVPTPLRYVEGHHAICGKAFADHFHGSELRILLRRKPSKQASMATFEIGLAERNSGSHDDIHEYTTVPNAQCNMPGRCLRDPCTTSAWKP